jgi:hypothetical protein
MPNWCNNTTVIRGNQKQLEKLLLKVTNKDGTTSLTNLKKMPAVLTRDPVKLKKYNKHPFTLELAFEKDQLIKEHQELCLRITGHKNSYEWANAEWGTKWGDCETRCFERHELGETSKTLSFNYETAWGPFENNFWSYVSSKFPRLHFINSYEEWGMGFGGAHVWIGGILVFYETYGYDDLKYEEDCSEADDEHAGCNCHEQATQELSTNAFNKAYEFVKRNEVELWEI